MRLLFSCPRVACAGGHRAALTIEQSLHGGVGNAWHPGRVPCPKTLRWHLWRLLLLQGTRCCWYYTYHITVKQPRAALPGLTRQTKKQVYHVLRTRIISFSFSFQSAQCPDRTEAKRLNRVYTSQSDYVYTKIWILNKHPCGRGTGRQAKRSRDWIHPNLSIFRCMCQAPSPGKGRKKTRTPGCQVAHWLQSVNPSPTKQKGNDGEYAWPFLRIFFGVSRGQKRERERSPFLLF